jgi:antitoxin ChpS
MELAIQKWGNSAAIRLPSGLLDQLHVATGDKLTVEVREGGVMLKPKRAAYSLAELLAQCDKNAPPPKDMTAWKDARPVGNEVW